jgi:hypothetical protein
MADARKRYEDRAREAIFTKFWRPDLLSKAEKKELWDHTYPLAAIAWRYKIKLPPKISINAADEFWEALCWRLIRDTPEFKKFPKRKRGRPKGVWSSNDKAAERQRRKRAKDEQSKVTIWKLLGMRDKNRP